MQARRKRGWYMQYITHSFDPDNNTIHVRHLTALGWTGTFLVRRAGDGYTDCLPCLSQDDASVVFSNLANKLFS